MEHRKTTTIEVQTFTTIPKGAARIVSFDPGSRWRLHAQIVTILRQVAIDAVLVRHGADDQTEVVSVAALAPAADAQRTPEGPLRLKAAEEHPPAVWAKAQKEMSQVAALVANPDVRRGDVAAAAHALGISERQVRRKIRRFQDLNTMDAFLPRHTGPTRGTTRLHPTVERLVGDEIRRTLKNSPDASVDDINPIVEAAAMALGLRAPGRSTVSRRLKKMRRQPELLPGLVGRELAYTHKPVKGPIEAAMPLSVVEMDHTVVDVHVKDQKYGKPMGRPWLTIAIDRLTRVILGMLLSLEAPSRLSVCLCLHHAVFPKLQWLATLGIPEACWPGFGLMHSLYTDNAREFTSLPHNPSFLTYNIYPALRPLGDPAAGGIVERAIGTLMGKVRLLPGSSFSKVLQKTPRHAYRAATLTLPELELFIARQISMYHKRRHDGLGMPPLTAWERAWTVNGVPCLPQVPDSAERFLLNFLPGQRRVVTREGIELDSLQYQSATLEPYIHPHVKRMVRVDPRDLSRVYVETDTAHIVAELSRHRGPAFSRYEWQEVHRRDRDIGRTRNPAKLADELKANRELIDRCAARSQRVRDVRRLAREEGWRQAQKGGQPRFKVLKAAPRSRVAVCRVEE